MKKTSFFGEFTRDDFSTIDQKTVAIVPVGAIEQHGPHLPVNTDSLILDYILTNAVQSCKKKIILTPLIQYGYSPHHFCYKGVLSLQSETLFAMLKDIGNSLIRSGFSKILFITGHGGNAQLIVQAAKDIGTNNSNVIVASTTYWNIAKTSLIKKMKDFTNWVPGHAGLFETSIVLAIRKDLVDMSKLDEISIDQNKNNNILFTELRKQADIERSNYHRLIQGMTDHPKNATGELGIALLQIINTDIIEFLTKFSKHG